MNQSIDINKYLSAIQSGDLDQQFQQQIQSSAMAQNIEEFTKGEGLHEIGNNLLFMGGEKLLENYGPKIASYVASKVDLPSLPSLPTLQDVKNLVANIKNPFASTEPPSNAGLDVVQETPDGIEMQDFANIQLDTEGRTLLSGANELSDVGTSLAEGAQSIIGNLFSGASSEFLSNAVGSVLGSGSGQLSSIASNFLGGTTEGASSVVSGLLGGATEGASSLANMAGNIAATATNMASNAASSIANSASSMAETAANTAANAIDATISTATNAASSVASTATSVATDAVSAAADTASAATDAAVGVGTAIGEAAADAAVGSAFGPLGTIAGLFIGGLSLFGIGEHDEEKAEDTAPPPPVGFLNPASQFL